MSELAADEHREVLTMITSSHRHGLINVSLEARNFDVVESAVVTGRPVMIIGAQLSETDISAEANAQRRMVEHARDRGVPITFFTPKGDWALVFETQSGPAHKLHFGIDDGVELDSVEGIARTAVSRTNRDDGHLGRVPDCTTQEHVNRAPSPKGTLMSDTQNDYILTSDVPAFLAEHAASTER